MFPIGSRIFRLISLLGGLRKLFEILALLRVPTIISLGRAFQKTTKVLNNLPRTSHKLNLKIKQPYVFRLTISYPNRSSIYFNLNQNI